MFCPHCGKQNPDNLVFCAFCGKDMTQTSSAQPAVKAKKKASAPKADIVYCDKGDSYRPPVSGSHFGNSPNLLPFRTAMELVKSTCKRHLS